MFVFALRACSVFCSSVSNKGAQQGFAAARAPVLLDVRRGSSPTPQATVLADVHAARCRLRWWKHTRLNRKGSKLRTANETTFLRSTKLLGVRGRAAGRRAQCTRSCSPRLSPSGSSWTCCARIVQRPGWGAYLERMATSELKPFAFCGAERKR